MTARLTRGYLPTDECAGCCTHRLCLDFFNYWKCSYLVCQEQMCKRNAIHLYIIFGKMKITMEHDGKCTTQSCQSDGWWLFAAHPLNLQVCERVCVLSRPSCCVISFSKGCLHPHLPRNPPSSLSPSPFIVTSLWPVYQLMWILTGWAEMLRLMMMPSLQYIWSSVRAVWTPRATSLAPQASSQYGG